MSCRVMTQFYFVYCYSIYSVAYFHPFASQAVLLLVVVDEVPVSSTLAEDDALQEPQVLLPLVGVDCCCGGCVCTGAACAVVTPALQSA